MPSVNVSMAWNGRDLLFSYLFLACSLHFLFLHCFIHAATIKHMALRKQLLSLWWAAIGYLKLLLSLKSREPFDAGSPKRSIEQSRIFKQTFSVMTVVLIQMDGIWIGGIWPPQGWQVQKEWVGRAFYGGWRAQNDLIKIYRHSNLPQHAVVHPIGKSRFLSKFKVFFFSSYFYVLIDWSMKSELLLPPIRIIIDVWKM